MPRPLSAALPRCAPADPPGVIKVAAFSKVLGISIGLEKVRELGLWVPEEAAFRDVLERFYEGEPDEATLELLR